MAVNYKMLNIKKFNWFRKYKVKPSSRLEKTAHKSYIEAGQVLRNQREKKGIAINELSRRTRISSFVIKTLENGSGKQLPENTYLKSMLNSLESELELDKGSLKGAIRNEIKQKNKEKNKVLTFIQPSKITSIQSTVVYLVLIFSSILFINRQQRYLSIINTQTTSPIAPIIVLEKEQNRK